MCSSAAALIGLPRCVINPASEYRSLDGSRRVGNVSAQRRTGLGAVARQSGVDNLDMFGAETGAGNGTPQNGAVAIPLPLIVKSAIETQQPLQRTA